MPIRSLTVTLSRRISTATLLDPIYTGRFLANPDESFEQHGSKMINGKSKCIKVFA